MMHHFLDSLTNVGLAATRQPPPSTYDSVLQGKWGSVMLKYVIRNSYLKYSLPMSIWVRIVRYLYPEDNIKLSLVSRAEYEYLLTHDGEFLQPPNEMPRSVPLPEWYDPDNFVLRCRAWDRCSQHKRQEYFSLMNGIRIAQCDGPAALLYGGDIVQLLKQNADSIERLDVTDSHGSVMNDLGQRQNGYSRKQLDRLLIPCDIDVSPVNRHLIPMKKLKTLCLRGSYVLHWMVRVLRQFRFESVETVVVRLPCFADTERNSKNGNGSLYMHKLQTIVTRFFAAFPNGCWFQFAAVPKDARTRQIVTACLQWIGSGSPSSKAFSRIEFLASDLRPLVGCLNRHLLDVLLKNGAAFDVLEDHTASCFFMSQSGLNEAPLPNMTDQASIIANTSPRNALATLHGSDGLDEPARDLRQQKIIGDSGNKNLEHHSVSVGNERSKNAKRFSKSEWMTAWKALRSLRSRQPKLKRLKLTGVVGPWCEILNLGAIFGPSVRIIADEFEGFIGDKWTGRVLEVLSPSLISLRLVACPMTSPLEPATSLQTVSSLTRKKSKKAVMTPQIGNLCLPEPTVQLSQSFVTHICDFPSLVFPRLKVLSLSNILICYADTLVDLLKRFKVPLPADQETGMSDAETGSEVGIAALNSKLFRKSVANVPTTQHSARKFTPRGITPNVSRRGVGSSVCPLISHQNPTTSRSQILLELLFAETPDHVVDSLNSPLVINFVKAVLSLFPVNQLTVCPCPHISLFREYQLLVRATRYTLFPFAISACWLAVTSDCHPNITQASRHTLQPFVEDVALRSFLSVRWLVKLGIYEENFKNILPLRTVSIESPLESLIGLTFAWDNFSLLQHLPSGYIDRLLQSAVDYITLCDLVQIYAKTLDSVTVCYAFPLDVYLNPAWRAVSLFLTLKDRLCRALKRRKECRRFRVLIDVKLRPFSSKSFPSVLPYVRSRKLNERSRLSAKTSNVSTEPLPQTDPLKWPKDMLDNSKWEGEEAEVMKQVAGLGTAEQQQAQERFKKALQAMGFDAEHAIVSSSSSENDDAMEDGLAAVTAPPRAAEHAVMFEKENVDNRPETQRNGRDQPTNTTVSEQLEKHTATRHYETTTVDWTNEPLNEIDPTLLLQSPTLLAGEITPSTSLEIHQENRDELESLLRLPENAAFCYLFEKKLKALGKLVTSPPKISPSNLMRGETGGSSLEYTSLASAVYSDFLISRRYILNASSSDDVNQFSPGDMTSEAARQGWTANSRWMPLILDTTGALLDQGVISPPYPDGGSLIIKIVKQSDAL